MFAIDRDVDFEEEEKAAEQLARSNDSSKSLKHDTWELASLWTSPPSKWYTYFTPLEHVSSSRFRDRSP